MKLIAETAWHHQGDFEFFKNLVSKIVKNENVDIIKLHLTIDFDEYMHFDHNAYSDLKNMMFKKEQWEQILDLIANSNKEKIFLCNDTKAIELGMKYIPEIVEIHSACLNDIHLLDSLKSNLGNTIKVMLGVGGSTLYEIEKAINRLEPDNVILMHGFQNYPTKYSDVNFGKIKKIMQLYPNYEHGYADHTAWDEPNNILITLFGAALGMQYVEKHVTTNYGQDRIDSSAAISFEMFDKLKDKLEILARCHGNGLLEMNEGEKKYSQFGPIKKAAFLNRDVNKDDVLTEEMIYFKRTSKTANLTQIDILDNIGKKFNTDISSNTILIKEMLS
ncbi:MAG: N-acetylneuraminate synthase family protein [Melioribacteraceae bacterium]|nr:N-acetylneuraminate synthase family protein [Saprospiraceae bacterium]MCF8355747.1 N-acetylneuraminate synthase family protein [Melioribacteraceae bacterium]MCF8394775.1 N-acetylneuraminate synthase family protein [Melioribacteraceae bacterium]